MLGVACYPQWRQLFSMDELSYYKLCVEFYSTFTHVVPTSKKSRPYVEFMLGGQPQVLTYDAFAQAMGFETTYMKTTKRSTPSTFITRPHSRPSTAPSTSRTSLRLAAPMR
ncbi:unnamed protein product [Linum trigynum]|uniref:Uncharacterized protein n=1 Tax=Linum trigynum TaxID=586398 RepID=A0AAV2GBU0_9ROSI